MKRFLLVVLMGICTVVDAIRINQNCNTLFEELYRIDRDINDEMTKEELEERVKTKLRELGVDPRCNAVFVPMEEVKNIIPRHVFAILNENGEVVGSIDADDLVKEIFEQRIKEIDEQKAQEERKGAEEETEAGAPGGPKNLAN